MKRAERRSKLDYPTNKNLMDMVNQHQWEEVRK